MGRSRWDRHGPRLSPDSPPRPRGAPDGTATGQGCPQTAPRGRGLPQEADEDPGAWRGGAIPTPSRFPSHHGARLADVRLVDGEMKKRPPGRTPTENPNPGIRSHPGREGAPQRKSPPWYPKPPWKRGDGGSTFTAPRNALSEIFRVSDRPSGRTPKGNLNPDAVRARSHAVARPRVRGRTTARLLALLQHPLPSRWCTKAPLERGVGGSIPKP